MQTNDYSQMALAAPVAGGRAKRVQIVLRC